MNQELIDMAKQGGLFEITKEGYEIFYPENLETFAALVAAAEREANAKIAGKLWQSFNDTRDAHERNSMDAFMGSRFGFEQSTIQQSKQIMEAIRARGEKK